MLEVFVIPESISSPAELVAKLTLVSRGVHMVGLNMLKNVCLHFECQSPSIFLDILDTIIDSRSKRSSFVTTIRKILFELFFLF